VIIILNVDIKRLLRNFALGRITELPIAETRDPQTLIKAKWTAL
jgi:hypothetical protein